MINPSPPPPLFHAITLNADANASQPLITGWTAVGDRIPVGGVDVFRSHLLDPAAHAHDIYPSRTARL